MVWLVPGTSRFPPGARFGRLGSPQRFWEGCSRAPWRGGLPPSRPATGGLATELVPRAPPGAGRRLASLGVAVAPGLGPRNRCTGGRAVPPDWPFNPWGNKLGLIVWASQGSKLDRLRCLSSSRRSSAINPDGICIPSPPTSCIVHLTLSLYHYLTGELMMMLTKSIRMR